MKTGGSGVDPEIRALLEHSKTLRPLPEVVRAHAKNGRYVEEMNGDTLYRADFRLCGYRTIRIQSRQMRGRVGWFFGNRPEFYFPRLPLSWGALGTGLFLPPLVLLAAVGIGRLTLNLKAPIVVNLKSRAARQIVANDEHPLQFVLPTMASRMKKIA